MRKRNTPMARALNFTTVQNDAKCRKLLKKVRNGFQFSSDLQAARYVVEKFTIFDPIFVDFAEQFVLTSEQKSNKTK
jgi:hypothetical protein